MVWYGMVGYEWYGMVSYGIVRMVLYGRVTPGRPGGPPPPQPPAGPSPPPGGRPNTPGGLWYGMVLLTMERGVRPHWSLLPTSALTLRSRSTSPRWPPCTMKPPEERHLCRQVEGGPLVEVCLADRRMVPRQVSGVWSGVFSWCVAPCCVWLYNCSV